MQRTQAPLSTQISFRVNETFAEELARRATLEGKSPGEWARCLIVEKLTDNGPENSGLSELAALKDEITLQRRTIEALMTQLTEARELAPLQNDIKRVREDIATSVVALLVKLGNADPDEAVSWVRQNLLT